MYSEIQKAHYQGILEASEQQRDIIFRNMHDQVNPMLRFVMRNMEMHRLRLRGNTLVPEAFESDIDMLMTALNDIRSCTHELAPAQLTESDLLAPSKRLVHS